MKTSIKSSLAKSSDLFLTAYTIIASFSVYSCMYALRKPIAVATFEGMSFEGIDYKIALLTAQVIGYTVSKFAGIEIISELKGQKRGIGIIALMILALGALFFFAYIPAPFNIVFLLLNGLPLGMIWGIVFSYLEGRRNTEVLAAGLSISFIFSSGFVKTVGKIVMDQWQVSEFWMPFVTGSLFLLPAIVFVWMLDQIPNPTKEDRDMRTIRLPMNKQQRKDFLKAFGPGLVMLVILYIFLTSFRDFRDNFSAELWESLGYGNNPEIFTLSEIPVSLGVLFVLASFVLIKKNISAFLTLHVLILFGVFLLGASTFAFEAKIINAPIWMVLVGLGLYLSYVPFNTILFDRLIAAFKKVGNVGFVIYVADAFGYLGSTGVMLFKNFGYANVSWLDFFISCSYFLFFSGTLLIAGSYFYFRAKYISEVQDESSKLSKVGLSLRLKKV